MEPCNRSGMTRATIRPPSRADAALLDKARNTIDCLSWSGASPGRVPPWHSWSRVVKTTCDGMLVEFASVVDAVRCAVAVQQAMPERDTGVAADSRIELRIGINLGDVIVEGDDLYGDGVNIAARIEALADVGGV